MQYRRLLIIIIMLVLVAGCKTQDKPKALLRSTKADNYLKLTLGLPKQDYIVGKDYFAEAILINSLSRHCVDSITGNTADVFGVVALDKNNKPVLPNEHSRIYEYSRSSSGGHESIYVTTKIRFKEPGTYKVFCCLKGAIYRTRGGNIPLILETDPIEITVRGS